MEKGIHTYLNGLKPVLSDLIEEDVIDDVCIPMFVETLPKMSGPRSINCFTSNAELIHLYLLTGISNQKHPPEKLLHWTF
ncbi:9124_t:CDS:2 [Funneliformis mosseae]|uniref:9124_t:CDS:1 n=1 Tax=Funneliformis mosseae TaxID=27381 RepID=A0A9N9C2P5_FUNMO|nr:9124_t:CDS:2 [Funneliformis mosseae]